MGHRHVMIYRRTHNQISKIFLFTCWTYKIYYTLLLMHYNMVAHTAICISSDMEVRCINVSTALIVGYQSVEQLSDDGLCLHSNIS